MSDKNTKEIIDSINQIKSLCEKCNNKVAAIEQALDDLQGRDVKPIIKEGTLEEDDIVAYWPDWYNPQTDDDQFAGFVEYGFSKRLVAGKQYYVELDSVAVFGEKLQMVANIYNTGDVPPFLVSDGIMGLLVQSYTIGSPEYRKMLECVYQASGGMFVEVRTKDLSEVVGWITLKTDDSGQLALDWETFKPDGTPPCRSRGLSKSLSAQFYEMDQAEREFYELLDEQTA